MNHELLQDTPLSHRALPAQRVGDRSPHEAAPRLSAIWVAPHDDPRQRETLEAHLAVLGRLPVTAELVIVVNGGSLSADDPVLTLLHTSPVPSRLVSLFRRCDESVAIVAGVQSARGELIAWLPGYLQTDPAELPRLLVEIDRGADYVGSWRWPRVDSKYNGLQSTLFNWIARYLTKVPLHDLNSTLRIMRRELAEHVPIYGDLHRFLPLLAATQGYRVTEVRTRHLEERVEKGAYRVGVYWRRLLDLLTLFFLIKFTRKPLRFFGMIGGAIGAAGALITAVLGVQRLLGTPLADRPALILGVLLIVLGFQLVSLGLLGELIIFTHGKLLREYHVEKVYESEPHA